MKLHVFHPRRDPYPTVFAIPSPGTADEAKEQATPTEAPVAPTKEHVDYDGKPLRVGTLDHYTPQPEDKLFGVH